MEKRNYIDTIYNPRIRPRTNYPEKLCSYLIDRFNIKSGEKILDLGCGRGDFSEGFEKLGCSVFAADLSESSFKPNNISIKYFNFEDEKFPFEENFFDVVFSKSIIEHLRNPEHAVKEVKRILKPGGKFIIMTPDWYSQQFIFYDDYTHVHPYTPKGLEDLLSIFMFKNIIVEKFYQLPFVWRKKWIKFFVFFMKIFGPVKKVYKNKFLRWSRELMILGYAEK